MHVVLLNQPFHPDVVATAQMGKDLGDALVARGHRVTAIASRSIYGQTGAVLPKRETIDGIEIHRLGSNVFGKRGFLSRVADFGLFYFLAAWRLLTLSPRPDVVVSFTTPPFIAMLGLICRMLRGSKAVYWVMDLYPDVGVAGGMFKPNALSTRLMERLSRRILSRSDATVVLGRCMRDVVLAKGVPADRVHYIPVWDAALKDDGQAGGKAPAHAAALRARWNLGSSFVVMYSGNFGLAHEAQTILDAIARLKDRSDIRFVFVGGGKRRPEVLRFIQEHHLENASYEEYVPREELGGLLAMADVHLVSVKPGFEGLIVPSKLFGILAAARPVLYVGPESSEIAVVLREADAGVVVSPGDVAGLADAVIRLSGDRVWREGLGRNASLAVPGRFDRVTACGQWARLLESLVPRPSGP